MTPEERTLRAQLGAHSQWANETDRAGRTAPARAAANTKFVTQAREMHPDATEEQIARAAEHLRKSHFARMALASVAARRRKAAAKKTPAGKPAA
ncbi:hypothetical protein AB0M28_13695 [Streptomyces sp. NPDC051940]|uniref:hypothetical protein n=1 Tax=Streptomyces sp. NPDC051940 TaxID=3155675 RepID=UPI003435BCD1